MKEIKRFHAGDLVEIIQAPDQNYYTRQYIGKIGMVLENVPTNSSPNIWKVLLLDNETLRLHAMDIDLVPQEKQDGSTR